MPEDKAVAKEDKWYKPSSPEMPVKRFYIETDKYRWVVHVWRYTIKETGTALYRAVAEEGHSAYGLTVNETINDMKSIMLMKLRASGDKGKTVLLDSVRSYFDPMDAAREDLKAAEAHSSRPLLARLFGL